MLSSVAARTLPPAVAEKTWKFRGMEEGGDVAFRHNPASVETKAERGRKMEGVFVGSILVRKFSLFFGH